MASICDGTKARETRNCHESANWLVRKDGEGGNFWAACDRHLAQVGAKLLEGEQGKLEVHHITTREP
jgi:hypothetical protein